MRNYESASLASSLPYKRRRVIISEELEDEDEYSLIES